MWIVQQWFVNFTLIQSSVHDMQAMVSNVQSLPTNASIDVEQVTRWGRLYEFSSIRYDSIVGNCNRITDGLNGEGVNISRILPLIPDKVFLQ
jgi:hypothetical protein